MVIGKMLVMKFVHLALWAVCLGSSTLYYLHRWPVDGIVDWLLVVPLGILWLYLIIFDLLPGLIIRILDGIQNQVGYAEKVEE